MIEIKIDNLLTEDDKEYIRNNISEKYLQIEDNILFVNKVKISDMERIPNLEKLFKYNSLFYNVKSNFRIYFEYNKDQKIQNKTETKSNRQFSYYSDLNVNKKTQELPAKFLNKIICGDSLKILKEIPDNTVDIVITSPPYNFGIDYGDYSDKKGWDEYFEKMNKIIFELYRVLKFGGRIVWNIQPLYNEYIPSHHIFSSLFLKNNFIWRNEILWEKNNYNAKYTSWGSWLSASSPYLKYTWEFIEVFSKGDVKKEREGFKSDITPEEFKSWVIGKWSIAPERRMKSFNHDAMFPEKLVERSLKLFSFPNDIVLDPFNGAGTTTKVADEFKRRYIGIDISKEYCNIAKDRLEGKYNGKK